MVGWSRPPCRYATEYSARGEGRAVGFIFDHSDLNAFCHALEVIVKLAADGLAGADACDLIDRSGVTRTRQEGVAAGMQGVADGNGAGMTTAAGVIYALAYHALRDNRHFNANLFHDMAPFKLWGRSLKQTHNQSVPLLYSVSAMLFMLLLLVDMADEPRVNRQENSLKILFPPARLRAFYVGGLFAFCALRHFKTDLLAFL